MSAQRYQEINDEIRRLNRRQEEIEREAHEPDADIDALKAENGWLVAKIHHLLKMADKELQ